MSEWDIQFRLLRIVFITGHKAKINSLKISFFYIIFLHKNDDDKMNSSGASMIVMNECACTCTFISLCLSLSLFLLFFSVFLSFFSGGIHCWTIYICFFFFHLRYQIVLCMHERMNWEAVWMSQKIVAHLIKMSLYIPPEKKK